MSFTQSVTMKTIACLLLVCCASAYGAFVPRIVGGRDAPEGKYPYQVSLRNNGFHFCGGSILNEHFVLTAAHCVLGSSPGSVKVHAGTNSRTSPGVVHAVEKIVVHPDYGTNPWRDDLAILRIASKIAFNEKIQSIPFAVTNFATAGTPAVLTGWGTLQVGGATPERLQEIDLLIEAQDRCQSFHSEVSDSEICTYTKPGEGACHGDSGGPLVANGVQVGIVSYGRPCAVGAPDVYTRVFYFNQWIKEQMNE